MSTNMGPRNGSRASRTVTATSRPTSHVSSNRAQPIEIGTPSRTEIPSTMESVEFTPSPPDDNRLPTPSRSQVGQKRTGPDGLEEQCSPKMYKRSNIIIEYGPGDSDRELVPFDILLEHSPKMTERFTAAEALRVAMARAKTLKKVLKKVVDPYNLNETFDDNAARAVLEECYLRYPLASFQIVLKKVIMETTEQQYKNNKMLKVPVSSGGFNKKQYGLSEVPARLRHLIPEAIAIIAQAVYVKLGRIKNTEEGGIRTNPIKAAADGRIIMYHVDRDSVRNLSIWLLGAPLPYSHPAQLCKVHSLASELGIQTLEKFCMDTLSNAMFKCIELADKQGLKLFDALQLPALTRDDSFNSSQQDPLDNVLSVVFDYVLDQNKPESELQKIAIRAIVRSRDARVYGRYISRFDKRMTDFLAHEAFALLREDEIKREEGMDFGTDMKQPLHRQSTHSHANTFKAGTQLPASLGGNHQQGSNGMADSSRSVVAELYDAAKWDDGAPESFTRDG
ncbi:hypothetical protein BCR34DRAFT_77371 [Clohesyomyces aquaticus]|uniref:Uncharacterized protein n=1 Tax=Clohesyomyces aquaticus TaxID=1231657 RepID=A0A1Y1YYF0_9PLEO|nr:hypothetical protein BCR34DRAFT_77371 [Clohesyomyces aquaticus]